MGYRIRDEVISIAARLCKYATIARSTAKGYDFITKPEAGADEPDNQEQARRLQDFGLRSVPVAGSECAVIASRGGSSNRIIVASENLEFGPLDLKEGEVCIYSKADTGSALCRIVLDGDGNVTVIPKDGAKVRLGDSAAANLDPVVLLTEMQTRFNALVDAYNGHSHLAGAYVAGATPVTGSSATPTSTASHLPNSAGSSNVLAKK